MLFSRLFYIISMTAARNGIDNTPTAEAEENLRELDAFLETASAKWSAYAESKGIGEHGFNITSGYRCEELNSLVGGSPTSPHLKGYAADVMVRNTAAWMDLCKWAAAFAKDCANSGVGFDSIVPESGGGYNWIHFSIRGFDGSQRMRSIEIPTGDGDFIPVTYGEGKDFGTPIDTEVEKKEIMYGSAHAEVEGIHGKNFLDLNEMPGSYSRVIFVMRRLREAFGLSVDHCAGILGNLLKDTDGRLSTTNTSKGYSGICMWTLTDQSRFRRMYSNDSSISSANLVTQVGFLISEMSRYRIAERIMRCRNYNDSCMLFYTLYERYGEKVDMTDTATASDCSDRRGYATAALEIWEAYNAKYDEDSLTGNYEGNGLDGPTVGLGDDTRLWNSHDVNLSEEDVKEFVDGQLREIDEMRELYKDYEI